MSIVCTLYWRAASALCASLLLLLLATACGGSGRDPTPTPTIDIVERTPTIVLPPPTPTPDVTPTPTYSEALDAMLVPGPTLPAPERFFFQNGSDLWQLTGNDPATRVTEGLDIQRWAAAADGSRAAIVLHREDDGVTLEEVRLIWPDGTQSEPVYGPVADPGGAAPTIVALAWTWDGAVLALVFNNGSAFALANLDGEASATAIAIPAGIAPPTTIAWAPSGAGVAYLIDTPEGAALYVTPNGDRAYPVMRPENRGIQSLTAFAWLPGRGRIAFVEAASAPAARLPGSIFTIAPDGSALELLVSASQFAPAARIVSIYPSTDGREVAFTVFVPDERGQPRFQSLWVQNIDTGDLRQVAVQVGYRVTDVWWTAAGLTWRGVDVGVAAPDGDASYTGSEPFILERLNAENGTATVIFQSLLAD